MQYIQFGPICERRGRERERESMTKKNEEKKFVLGLNYALVT